MGVLTAPLLHSVEFTDGKGDPVGVEPKDDDLIDGGRTDVVAVDGIELRIELGLELGLGISIPCCAGTGCAMGCRMSAGGET